MKLRTKLLAVGAVAVLVVSGLALALMASSNASADDDVPVVTVADDSTLDGTSDGTSSVASNATHNLTVLVTCKVNGTRAAVAGVDVTVCVMNITREENRTVIEIVKVAEGQTDENGTVTFTLAEGKYFVFAEHDGKRGFCRGNLSEDTMVMVKMHHWNWGHMKGQKFHFVDQCRDGSCGGDCTKGLNCTGGKACAAEGNGHE